MIDRKTVVPGMILTADGSRVEFAKSAPHFDPPTALAAREQAFTHWKPPSSPASSLRRSDTSAGGHRSKEIWTGSIKTVGGLALALRRDLAELAGRHNVAPSSGQLVQSLPECDERACILSGYATVPTIDLEHMCFARHSLGWYPWALPKLLWRHREEEVGRVLSLEWDGTGLRANVETSHLEAMNAPGFSVCVTIEKYELKNTNSPDYFAEITRGWLENISLTDRPAHPMALIHQRAPACAQVAFLDLATAGFKTMIKIAQTLQQMEQPTCP
jgi:hypothetical protein